MRDELLAIEQFDTLLEAQVLIADWRIEYNTYRPHSALGMLTPVEFADHWRQTNPPKLSMAYVLEWTYPDIWGSRAVAARSW